MAKADRFAHLLAFFFLASSLFILAPFGLGLIVFGLLRLAICAIISGATGWEDIEDFGKAKLNWLRQYRSFESGIPRHDTSAWVIYHLKPSELEAWWNKSQQEGLVSGYSEHTQVDYGHGRIETRHCRQSVVDPLS